MSGTTEERADKRASISGPASTSGSGLRWQGPDATLEPSPSQRLEAPDESEELEPDPVQLSPFEKIEELRIQFLSRSYKLTLRSCFGASSCANAVSAALGGEPAILYAASHAAVLLAVHSQPPQQAQLLQGHSNAVTALTSDATGRWVATGDAGADNALIVWDTNLCVPVLSLFDWSTEGCRLLALSPDARLLVAVSDATSPQVAVFRWTLGPEKPDAIEILSEFGRANHLSFGESSEMVVTSATSVAFVNTSASSGSGMRMQRPELPRASGGRCARLVSSAFVPARASAPGPRLALTATARGSIVVWAVVDDAWTLFKEVQAQRDAITALLVSSNGVVVTGNAKGQLRFYDAQLRILYWWQNFTLDSITSLEFHTCSEQLRNSQTSMDDACYIPTLPATMNPAGAFVTEAPGTMPVLTLESESLEGVNWPCSSQTPSGMLAAGPVASCPRMPGPPTITSSTTRTSISMPADPAEPGNTRESRRISLRMRGSATVASTVTESDIEEAETDEEMVPEVISDATLQRRPFLLDNLLVCSLYGDIGVVNVSAGRYERIVVGGAAITKIDAHPEKTQVATGSCAGELRIYAYAGCGSLLVRADLPSSGGAVTALRYAPSGLLLVAGRENGTLALVEPVTLHLIAELRHLPSDPPAIRLLEFAPDSQAIAVVDESMALTLWTHHGCAPDFTDEVGSREDEVLRTRCSRDAAIKAAQSREAAKALDLKEGDIYGWRHAGKLRAHYRRVVALIFSPDGERILTLAEDRALAECGRGPDGLHLVGLERVEQTAVPCAMIWAPRLSSPEPLLFVSNNELKFKTLSDATRMCTSTVLAPDLGSPVRLMQLVGTGHRPGAKAALLIAAGERQLGLQLLPSDGNPFKCVSVIGHPDQLTQICVSNDSQYVFTIGRDDPCVLQWQINPRAVEVSARMAGPGLAPFFALLPGGPDGWLLQEMQDLFIYSQLLHQGESTPAPRRLIDSVPVCELPDLMRALGYFPSEYEIENLLHEVNLGPTGSSAQPQQAERVKFDHFVRLFVNHRPAVGLQTDRLRSAFNTFTDTRNCTLRREAFMSALVDLGEGLTRDQVLKYLSVLMRKHGKRSADDDLEVFFSRLPTELSFAQFRDEILGIIYQLPASAVATQSGTRDGGLLPPK